MTLARTETSCLLSAFEDCSVARAEYIGAEILGESCTEEVREAVAAKGGVVGKGMGDGIAGERGGMTVEVEENN